MPGQPGRIRSAVSAALAILAFAILLAPASAQTAPSAHEIAAYTGVFAAAQGGDVAAIAGLSKAPSKSVQQLDDNGRTPLHVATFARQRAAVAALIAAGANTAALDKDRYDAVTIAAVADDEETLGVLLAHGASAKLVTSRYDGTALIAAAHLGHDGVVRQLLAAGAPVDHVNNLHWTALIEAIVLGDGGPRHQRCASALLGAGANTQLTDRDGRTPLELARSRGYGAMERLLRDAGAR
ncbi:MAG: ankyrin repeat domain-containing protein [Betaproteobacteria bacterium]